MKIKTYIKIAILGAMLALTTAFANNETSGNQDSTAQEELPVLSSISILPEDQQSNLNAALFRAIRKSGIDSVKNRIREGAQLDARSEKQQDTPLHAAAAQGKEKMVILFLERGADPLAVNSNGDTPRAIILKSTRGAKVGRDRIEKILESAESSKKQGQLHQEGEESLSRFNSDEPPGKKSQMNDELEAKGLEIEPLFGDDNEILRFINEDEANEHEGTGSMCINTDTSPVDQAALAFERDLNGHTFSVDEDSPEKEPLVEQEPAILDQETLERLNQALLATTRRFGSEKVQALIEKEASVHARNCHDRTPLHIAVTEVRLNIVELLLKAGADPCVINKKGKTPRDLVKESKCCTPLRRNKVEKCLKIAEDEKAQQILLDTEMLEWATELETLHLELSPEELKRVLQNRSTRPSTKGAEPPRKQFRGNGELEAEGLELEPLFAGDSEILNFRNGDDDDDDFVYLDEEGDGDDLCSYPNNEDGDEPDGSESIPVYRFTGPVVQAALNGVAAAVLFQSQKNTY